MAKHLSLAIAGLGTVGSAVAKLLLDNKQLYAKRCGIEIEINAVSARDKNKDRGFELPSSCKWFEEAPKLAELNNIDVIIELIGGDEGAARRLVETALQNGKSVVTANKALIAKHGKKLAQIAEQNDCYLYFEAAVAGGIPVISALHSGLAANNYRKIIAILNGTCNFILSVMEEQGRDFADVLQEAQDLGYAESDPTFDIDGIDTAHKLAIISALSYGISPTSQDMYIEGIRKITAQDIQYAKEMNQKIRLVGISETTADGLLQRVHPIMLPAEHPIANTHGPDNAVMIQGDAVGDILLKGAGAGGMATASAVISDIMQIARNSCHNSQNTSQNIYPFGVSANSLAEPPISKFGNMEIAAYLRLKVADRPGVLADFANIFNEEQISIKNMLQTNEQQWQNRFSNESESDKQSSGYHTANETASLLVITHPAREAAISRAIERLGALDTVIEEPHIIRIIS